MCPALADELLSAICRTANIQKISSFLKENSSAKVVGMDGKPRRTLKRRSRGVPWHTTSKAQKSRHDNGKKPNARNRKKNAQRKAKAKKRCYESECASWSDKRRIQKDEALWLCMDTQTRQCGGKLSRQRWKTCAHRGFGRLCFRCQDCEQYWDVLVSVVRLPLLVVWRLLELYFDHCPVLSAQAIGCSLGCSASPAQQALDSKNLGSEKQNTRCENKCRTFAFALQHVAQAWRTLCFGLSIFFLRRRPD